MPSGHEVLQIRNSSLLGAGLLVVADNLVDDEAQEFFAELGIELGLLGQRPQAGDLPFLSRRIGGGQGIPRLVTPDRLGDPEALGQHVNQGRVDIVDALAVSAENRIGLVARIMVHGVVHRPPR